MKLLPAHLVSNDGLLPGKNEPENQAVQVYFDLAGFRLVNFLFSLAA